MKFYKVVFKKGNQWVSPIYEKVYSENQSVSKESGTMGLFVYGLEDHELMSDNMRLFLSGLSSKPELTIFEVVVVNAHKVATQEYVADTVLLVKPVQLYDRIRIPRED